MRQTPLVPLKDSIATQLLKVVFALYLILVVTVTAFHMLAEYAHTKADVLQELQSFEMTVKPGLGQALWEMNLTQMHSIMVGIVKLPTIVGVHVEDDQGNVIEQIGQVLNPQGEPIVADQKGMQTVESTASGLFWHEFSLSYTRGDRDFPVGNVTMYSSSAVVFQRIRFGFLLLMIAAVIQIVAFWILFLWISRTRLSHPLTELTYAAGQLDLDNLENITIQVHTSGRNELKILEETFNAMIRKLLTAREKLQELNRTLQRHRDELELRVQERTKALRQSEAELRALFAGMTDVVLMIDREGRYLKIAPTSPELLYKPADELLGTTLHETFSQDQADLFLEHIHQSLDTQQLVKLEYSLNIGGSDLWFDGRVAPMSNNTVVFVARDITERKRMENDLRRAKDAAEAASRAKSTFLANMSHELRTPLNSILGFAQQLKQDATLTESQQQSVGIIYRNGEHLLTLLNDILDFTKIEANTLELHPEQFALPSLIRRLAEMAQLNAEHKGLSFAYEAPADLPRIVYGDQKRLRQILFNLLGNAVKFTEEGRITLRVKTVFSNQYSVISNQYSVFSEQATTEHCSLTTEHCSLVFEIEDTGIGIPSDQLEAIFQPFQQADPYKLQEGSSGLGLAISQRLVKMMGSQIHVTSTEGQGTIFWFDLQLPVIETMAFQRASESLSIPEKISAFDESLPPLSALLPADLIGTLRQAAEESDIEVLFEVIAHIREREPGLADALARLAEDFEYDEILRLIQDSV